MAGPRTIANLGDGVKTADIGDDQVTTAKLADDAVTGDKLNPALFRANLTSSITVATATPTKVTGWTAVTDTESGFSDADDEYTVPESGIYLIIVQLQIPDTTTGDTALYVKSDEAGGGTINWLIVLRENRDSGFASQGNVIQATSMINLTAGDKIYLNIEHNVGSDQTYAVGGLGYNIWQMLRVG